MLRELSLPFGERCPQLDCTVTACMEQSGVKEERGRSRSTRSDKENLLHRYDVGVLQESSIGGRLRGRGQVLHHGPAKASNLCFIR